MSEKIARRYFLPGGLRPYYDIELSPEDLMASTSDKRCLAIYASGVDEPIILREGESLKVSNTGLFIDLTRDDGTLLCRYTGEIGLGVRNRPDSDFL